MLFGDSPPPGLVGIAKLAAQSPILVSKAKVQYFDIASRSLLNRTRPGLPFAWTINPYRGCEFGCKYCYARYTHEFMGLQDDRAFEDRIYAKAHSDEILRHELRKVPLREGIAIGTATDPYQPAERRFERTRSILEVFSKGRRRRLSITTKSDLILRDLPLLIEIAAANSLHINMTITTLQPALARKLEPRAPHPDLRLAAVRKLSDAGLKVGVFPNPIMPLITDREAQLDRLAKAAKDSGATYFGGGILFLMPAARRVFFPFLQEHFPHLLPKYEEHYRREAYLKGAYKEMMRERIASIRDRYGLASGPIPDSFESFEEQPSLFPLQ